jgi:transposase
MECLRIRLTEDEQGVVMELRESHPDLTVRRKMWTVWLLHCRMTREKAAEIVGVARSTVERYVAEYREGGLDGLQLRREPFKPVSDLAAHADKIRESFEKQPVRTIAEASQRIFDLTGIRRSPTQVRTFLKGLGMTWKRVRAIPVPPKKTWTSTQPIKRLFTTAN